MATPVKNPRSHHSQENIDPNVPSCAPPPSEMAAAAKTPASKRAASSNKPISQTPARTLKEAAPPDMAMPVKNSRFHHSHEKVDPACTPPPLEKAVKTPASKRAASSKKPISKTPARILTAAAPPPARQRKFIVARKTSMRAGDEVDSAKRRHEAYDALRASQEEFFRKDASSGSATTSKEGGLEVGVVKDTENEAVDVSVSDDQDLEGGSEKARKMRSIVMAEAMCSVPEPGSGRVKHLVQAFESFLSISNEGKSNSGEDRKLKGWALPGLQPTFTCGESGTLPASISPAELFPVRDFERDLRLYSSLDSNGDRLSLQSSTSARGQRSRKNSLESTRNSWKKMLKVTYLKPFKLRTEQRGRVKEDKFVKKVQEMLLEEEKKRIPIAQGLPWTTDEPECLVKPPVKVSMEPIDIVLHSDIRAVERAEFDHYVVERMSLAEKLRFEREMQKKFEEEEEIRQLRRELMPKAQPMPYFDRPFVPKRSDRPQTVPKDPSFHVRPVKSSRSRVLAMRR